MISKRDLQLGKIALKAGMVTKDQITRCLALKKKLAAEKGKKVSLGALLIKKGYLTEAQLEELVKLQPATSEVSGETSGEAGAVPKKKKKAAGATSEASETATATSAPPSEAVSEAQKSGEVPGHTNGAGAGANGEGSEEAVAEAAREAKKDDDKKGDEEKKKKSGKSSRGEDTGKSKRAKQQSARQKAEKPSAEGSTAGAVESAVESTTSSDVDPSIFLSAAEGATDEEDKRLIACPECGKKYRVRSVQAGKRFSCRRCKNKVKVPKDLFDKPVEKKSGKKKSKGEVEVEEFTLGSSDQTEPAEGDGAAKTAHGDGDEPKTSARTAAVKAAVAIQKVQAQASIADLAKAATKHQKKGLPPRRKFGVVQAVTLVACIGTVVGIVGGVIAFKQHLAAVEEEGRRAIAAAELDAWKKKVQEVLDRIDPALKTKQPTELGSLLSDLQSRAKEHELLAKGDNRQSAAAWLETLDLPARRRAVLLARADALWQTGTIGADESLQVLGQALELAKGDDELAVVLGRRLIKAGKTAEAAQRTSGRASPGAAAIAGLAFERGGAADKAAQNYAKVPGPLGAVLAARAFLSDRNADRALAEVAKAADATGADLAAAKMVEAQAQAMRDDFEAAKRAVAAAISAAGDLPWPKALEGELLLRTGDAAGALAAFQAANQIAGTARGYLGIGDACAVLLDLDRARSAWNDASQAPVALEKSPLAPGDVDPFEAPMAPDPRALACCRIGALDAAVGRSSAAEEYAKALQRDPFCVEAEAGLAILDIRANNLPFADARLLAALQRIKKQGGEATDTVRSGTAATLLVARAFWLISSGRPKDADKLLQQAKSADPAVAPQVAALTGRLHEADSKHGEAYTAFSEAAQLEVQAAFPAGQPFQAAWKLLGAGPSDAPTQEKILAGVTATLAQNPWHARAHVMRARVLIAQGKVSQALPSLDQAIALNTYLREAYIVRGFLYVRDLPERDRTRDMAANAAKDFEYALRIEARQGGEKAETHRGLALVHLSQNNLGAAHEAATKAIGLDAQDAEALRVRAQIRTRQGNKPGAAEDEAKAAALGKK